MSCALEKEEKLNLNFRIREKEDAFEKFRKDQFILTPEQMREAIKGVKLRKRKILEREKPFLKINLANAKNFQELQTRSFYSLVGNSSLLRWE